MNGNELIAAFRRTRSDAAFAELVRAYTNLVYAAAKRRLGNGSLAEEVTQIVFIRLAKSGAEFSSERELVAWLHRTAVTASIDLWRSEHRRDRREQEAADMQSQSTESATWEEISPLLDEALNQLSDGDRAALLLRFFHDTSMRDVGGALGISEDAAKMRVARAVERLRRVLGARGATCTALGLGTMLKERVIEAAPGAFAARLAAFRFPLAPVSIGGGAVLLGRLTLPRLALVGTALVVISSFLALKRDWIAGSTSPAGIAEHEQTTVAQEISASAEAPDRAGIAASPAKPVPDPLILLERVAAARTRFPRGLIEYELESPDYTRRETNRVRLAVLFDEGKLRCEQFGREYAYTGVGEDAARSADEKIKELGFDRAAAVEAGLLRGFEAHDVTIYDGSALLKYRETDRDTHDTTIDDPAKGGHGWMFDPRTVGLASWPSRGATVKLCLGFEGARLTRLLGKETVNGVVAWHVEVHTKQGDPREFWIDAAHPERVVKFMSPTTGTTVLSRYISGPFPAEVTATGRIGSYRIVQTRADFSVAPEPAIWTLSGLNMAVGTPIVDVRISRRIGYWTGHGLSDDLPNQQQPAPGPKQERNEMLALLRHDSGSASALEAAQWIILNTPDGPDVELAADVILSQHVKSPDLTGFARELERVRPRSAPRLLESLMKENPSPNVRANACFTLATLREDQSNHGKDKRAAAEAELLFARVVQDLGRRATNGVDLVHKARKRLYELQNLTIGKPAPAFEGKDLHGKRINLRDYRGQIVILAFWDDHYSEASEHRKFLEACAGKPVAVIGVCCEDKRSAARAVIEREEITWPVILDGRSGPLAKTWNIDSWTSIFVLDQDGIIRHRDLRFASELEKAVDQLLPSEGR